MLISAVAPAVCAFLVLVPGLCICSYRLLSNFSSALRRNSDPHRYNYVYADADGEASERTIQHTGRLTKWLIVAFAFVTLLASIPSVVLLDFDVPHISVLVGWGIVNIYAISLCFEPSQIQRFNYGLLITASSILMCLALFQSENSDEHSDRHGEDQFHIPLAWAQGILGLCLAVASSTLRRRPAVFFEGREVDQQFACSAIERIGFSWVLPLLNQARCVRRIDYGDLPALDHTMRSNDLESRCMSGSPFMSSRPLWRSILRNHYSAIGRQWILAVVEGAVTMLPPYCLSKVLEELEQGAPGAGAVSRNLLFWTVWLACSKVVHVVLDNWLYWISFAVVAIPIRSQLSALIFSKSLRITVNVEMDDGQTVTESEASAPNHDASNVPEAFDEMEPLLPAAEPTKADKDEEDTEKTETPSAGISKGIVNLLGVDLMRVYIFCGYNVDLIRAAVKVFVAVALLVSLMGWWSTIAGAMAPVILQPLIRTAQQRYSVTQVQVMEARDDKAHVVREALHGVRQIKFTATELEWEKRISKSVNKNYGDSGNATIGPSY